jgi:hypothetical protein
MGALPLIDLVLSSPNRTGQSRAITSQLMESALRELEQLKRLDDTLMPDSKAASDRPTAVLVRGMYEEWAHQAEALLERVERLQSRSGPVDGYELLRDAHGRTKAMLSVSLEEMEQARRDVAEGRLIPAQEVRRELRLGVG